MYLPAAFEVTDLARCAEVVRRWPLATWATVVDGLPCVNHVPFHLDPTRGPNGTLIGHVARANPVWRQPGPAVLAFVGPQAYVSPSWYPSKARTHQVVPTWNYAVVHAHGTPQAIEDPERLHAIVSRLTDAHEAGREAPWAVDDAPADYVQKMLGAIVGIEIPVERWVGKFKLSQNRSAEDRAGVEAGLARAHPDDASVDWMVGAARPRPTT
jgi:transcriptional regulator